MFFVNSISPKQPNPLDVSAFFLRAMPDHSIAFVTIFSKYCWTLVSYLTATVASVSPVSPVKNKNFSYLLSDTPTEIENSLSVHCLRISTCERAVIESPTL